MDIQKRDNCKVICLALMWGLLWLDPLHAVDDRSATETLRATYIPSAEMSPEYMESAISSLQKVLTNCRDEYLAFRINYRIAVLYFRSGKMEDAKQRFELIADSPLCPELIRLFSYNMTAQICRLQGENLAAIDSFDTVITFIKKTTSRRNDLMLQRLALSSMIARAEIYEMNGDLSESFREYGRMQAMIHENSGEQLRQTYSPLAIDRMAKLSLRLDKVDQYGELVEGLVTSHPGYVRVPVIEFEYECVKFLTDSGIELDFKKGAFGAPASVVSFLNTSKDSEFVEPFGRRIGHLCKKYEDSEWSFLLLYHYAWMLDAAGRDDEAVKVFDMICSSTANQDSKSGLGPVSISGVLREYAKIQNVIMLSEREDYSQALRVLATIERKNSDSHVSTLAKSIGKSIEILKREVPRNVAK